MPARHFVLAATAALILCAGVFPSSGAIAQDARPSSVLPSGGGQALLDPSDTVLLLLDHQTGLFQTVKDIGIVELRTNTAMLAKLAVMHGIPVITSASEPNGPNGPLMPEIAQVAPNAIYVPRKGEVNAWDSQDFVDTVRKTGRKTLIIAGVWTSVCVMFPALDAKAAATRSMRSWTPPAIRANLPLERRSRGLPRRASFRPRRTRC